MRREPVTIVGYARLVGALEALENAARWLCDQNPNDPQLDGLRRHLNAVDRLTEAERFNV